MRARTDAPAGHGFLLVDTCKNGRRGLTVNDSRPCANGLALPLDGLAALARKRRLGNKNVIALGKNCIDRAEHTGIQANHIAGHKPVGIDLNPACVNTLPDGRMARLQHMAVKAARGLIFIEQAHQAADQPHCKQHSRREHSRLALRLRNDIDQKSQTGQRK